ncbi:MAG: hypothetical protein BWY25_03251 [Chloroflexi bacterium ADurb.Bin222]|nr:MAG: hypothetical protein BWY25_03251 [Chloroflexi bacterium ADurb.Bin222]
MEGTTQNQPTHLLRRADGDVLTDGSARRVAFEDAGGPLELAQHLQAIFGVAFQTEIGGHRLAAAENQEAVAPPALREIERQARAGPVERRQPIPRAGNDGNGNGAIAEGHVVQRGAVLGPELPQFFME